MSAVSPTAPKVSVSLVTYNHARFVGQALDGILMQETAFNFDIIVGDDFSTDATRAVVAKYQERFPGRIKTVYPSCNLGDAGRQMFVETIRHCRGQYIAMLDGDDYWTAPDKLQRQADFLDSHPQCTLCYHDVSVISDVSEQQIAANYLPFDHPTFTSTEEVLRSCFVPGCSGMIRGDVVSEFPDWFFAGPWADLPLYIMAAEKGDLGFIREVMGVYRVHGGGVWSSLDEVAQLRSGLAALETLGPEIAAKYPARLARSKAWHHWHLARKLTKRGQLLKGAGHLAHAAALRLDEAVRK